MDGTYLVGNLRFGTFATSLHVHKQNKTLAYCSHRLPFARISCIPPYACLPACLPRPPTLSEERRQRPAGRGM